MAALASLSVGMTKRYKQLWFILQVLLVACYKCTLINDEQIRWLYIRLTVYLLGIASKLPLARCVDY